MGQFKIRWRRFREIRLPHRVIICFLWFAAAIGVVAPPIHAQSPPERPVPAITVMAGPTRTTTDSETFKLLGDLGKQINGAWAKTAPLSLNIANAKRVVVGFTLKNDGTIADDKVIVEKSSGDPALDDAGVRAVRAGAPFKISASNFKASKIELHVTFDDDVAHSPLGIGNP